MTTLAFVFSSLPHASAAGREGLDALLATSAFTEDIKVFFVGNGVNQLRKGQETRSILSRDYISAFKLMDLYDIEQVFVCEQSLERYRLTEEELLISAQVVSACAIADELNQCHKVLTF
ncbi:sulfurtransferase complex subunit TusC [Vibrio sp. SCSIO 43140]|uniref:sulfurtransferase complex subunit TusC n=1 Tax=Vibrio sp. SCSIO 43140 TaxID=2819100 RepID=UPI00207565E2|nr:sulfurtransferase complex subunit TusC [Vibrio sp. SCSIO 43140]USD60702.1 sulfurtransferase complex subunit TusC [Vibrio sp. SCSIO 43140]